MSSILSNSTDRIENRIFTIRGAHVMLDSDLAEIYSVATSRLNEQVKRNEERFPEDYMFKLSDEEWANLISQNATSSASLKDLGKKWFAFSKLDKLSVENMLNSILKLI